MQGLMQHWRVDGRQDHRPRQALWHGGREVVTPLGRGADRPHHLWRDPRRAPSGCRTPLLGLGIKPGDRVATLAWNTARHMEAWYGIMGDGGGLPHPEPAPVPRTDLPTSSTTPATASIFTDLTFLPILAGILQHDADRRARGAVHRPRPHARRLRPAGVTPDFKGLLCYEDLVAQHDADCAWGGFDENTAAGLCYTSGTTGNPKGVLYSHRSNFLHTLITLQPDVLGLSQTRRRSCRWCRCSTPTPGAWRSRLRGAGAKLVMPGAKMDGASMLRAARDRGRHLLGRRAHGLADAAAAPEGDRAASCRR